MATRPIFRPFLGGPPFVKRIELEFKWHPGCATSQARKSIASLHEAAKAEGLDPVLEVSTKSEHPLGVRLSAFHLSSRIREQRLTVESAFQGSKVFEQGGPYNDIYSVSGRDAKADERLRSSGRLVRFNLMGDEWPTEPSTCFYDWLYMTALAQQQDTIHELFRFNAFSDIAFNPNKSLNCQARSAAVFVALSRQGLLDRAIRSKAAYLELLAGLSHVRDDGEMLPREFAFVSAGT